ncbi:MAG: hypothetical protein HKN35_06280 [Woeseia sp.]|nr:hypothetical protein [Woeseia sp.]MBT8098003.1 hypothetical protein [Woeseia sp.]NNE60479.1 hypothetical protein [Woeseia sp.]NNL54525.1 hypothetical protein [Woeseia sp.]
MSNGQEIPVLTDVLQRASSEKTAAEFDQLQTDICTASLRLAEVKLRQACKEAELEITERVMAELRAELPLIVRAAIRRHSKT